MFIEIIKKVPEGTSIFGVPVESYQVGKVIGLRNGIAGELCKMKLAKPADEAALKATAAKAPPAAKGFGGGKREETSGAESSGETA